MKHILIFAPFITILFLLGCSSSHLTAPDSYMINVTSKNSGTEISGCGTFSINLDNKTIDVTENRTADYNFNITGFLGSACSGGCFRFRIVNVMGTVLEIELKLENPTSLQVYDVRLVYTNLYGKTVLNPDSYTDLFMKGMIVPFTAFAKEYPRRAFPKGPQAYDTETLFLDFPPGALASVDFFIVASYPSNTEEPYELANPNCSAGLTTTGGSAILSVHVKDHQDDVTIVRADTRVLTGGFTTLLEDPSVPDSYKATISNTAGAPAGDYTILFKAESPNPHNASTYNYCTAKVIEGQQRGKIVYVSWPNGNPDICRINDDGTGYQRLTTSSDHDWEPCWSPDGTKIVWRNGGYGTANIWIMNEDGSNKKQVTTNGWNFDPQWDPAGQWIYYWSYYGSGGASTQIWKVRPDGTDQQQVSSFSQYYWISPAVSPNNDYIAMEVGGQTSARDIYIMKIDGSNVTQITNTPYWEAYPRFTLDGRKILFTSDKLGYFTLFIMNLDGNNVEQLSYPPSGLQDFEGVSTSSSSKFIIWRRFDSSTMYMDEIGVYDTLTQSFTNLTNNAYPDMQPRWHRLD